MRSRLYLSRPADGEGLPEERILTRKKSNYSASGDDEAIRLAWGSGVLRTTDGNDERIVQNLKHFIKQEVAAAWTAGQPYVSRPKHPRHLEASMIALMGSRSPLYEKNAVLEAIQQLRVAGQIEVARTMKLRGYKTEDQ